MSEVNEGEEEKPGRAGSLGSDEFEFYFSFTKPLVLELSSSEDKALAAAWVQKLEVEPTSEEEKQQRLNYLKLFLFVLQRGRLSGIFKKQPPAGPLQPLPQGLTILDVGSLMLEQDDSQISGGGDARRVPYAIEISNDLREFVASQEVPNFGIQMYYAWSSEEPIHKWSSFEEEKFPQYILDKIKQLKEIKSDDKSTLARTVCGGKRRGCDVNLPDRFSRKKVKSPQEIERSQGRSLYAYMGLVGRMGNFSDKCDEDMMMPNFQRQGRDRASCRNVQIRCPENGGEAEDMAPGEQFDNAAADFDGENAFPPPGACREQPVCDNRPGGGPQAFDEQQGPERVCPRSPRRNRDNAGRDADGIIFGQDGFMEGPCLDNQGAAGMQCPPAMAQERRMPFTRARSASPNRPTSSRGRLSDDNAAGMRPGRFCVCRFPPCTCPCPRAPLEGSAGRPPQAPGVAIPGADVCRPQSQGQGRPMYGPQPRPTGQGGARAGGRTGAVPAQPGVAHCHDNPNLDPRTQVTSER